MANPILTEFKKYAKWGATNFMSKFNILAYDNSTREGIQSFLYDFRMKVGTAINSIEIVLNAIKDEIRLLKAKGVYRGNYRTEAEILALPNPKLGDMATLETGITTKVYQEYIWDQQWHKAGQVGAIMSLDYASKQEATTGTANDKIMTPLRTKQAVSNKLEKGNGLKVSNAKELEQQIEILSKITKSFYIQVGTNTTINEIINTTISISQVGYRIVSMTHSGYVGSFNTNLEDSNYVNDTFKYKISTKNNFLQYAVKEQSQMANGHTISVIVNYEKI